MEEKTADSGRFFTAPVLTLMALGFVLGSCEYVVVAILPDIAEGLNASLGAVGKLVGVFAAGYAVGTPIVTAATGRVPRFRLLMVLLGLFLGANALSMLAPNLWVLYAARALAAAGADSYVLNIGGNIRIIGTKPDGTGWPTGIRNPKDESGEFAATLYLANTSCSTSGVYERYFVVDGRRYHHIINPDTLYPAEYYASVIIVTPDSGYADALSTALFCLPIEEGMQLVQALGDAEALWIFPNGEIRYTPGMADYIQK